MGENKNMLEIAKVGECLLVEVVEMEKYQQQLKDNMDNINEKFQGIAGKVEECEDRIESVKVKYDQLVELAAEFEEEFVKEKIFEKAGVHKSEIDAIKEEIVEHEKELGELEEEFNALNKMNVNAEYGKNILLAFGAKYGFLIKKEKEDADADLPESLEE